MSFLGYNYWVCCNSSPCSILTCNYACTFKCYFGFLCLYVKYKKVCAIKGSKYFYYIIMMSYLLLIFSSPGKTRVSLWHGKVCMHVSVGLVNITLLLRNHLVSSNHIWYGRSLVDKG